MLTIQDVTNLTLLLTLIFLRRRKPSNLWATFQIELFILKLEAQRMTAQNLIFLSSLISPVEGICFSTSISFQSPSCNMIKMFHAGQIISDNWMTYEELYLKCDLTNWLSPKHRADWLSMDQFKLTPGIMGKVIPLFFKLLLTRYLVVSIFFWLLNTFPSWVVPLPIIILALTSSKTVKVPILISQPWEVS